MPHQVNSEPKDSCVHAGAITGITTLLHKRSRVKLALGSCDDDIVVSQTLESVIGGLHVGNDFLVVPHLGDTLILGTTS